MKTINLTSPQIGLLIIALHKTINIIKGKIRNKSKSNERIEKLRIEILYIQLAEFESTLKTLQTLETL